MINALWNALCGVRQLELKVVSGRINDFNWEGAAAGRVLVSKTADTIITFTEAGRWTTPFHNVSFYNVYRWSLIEEGRVIRLEHLRFGADMPVSLVDFAPLSPNLMLRSIAAHLCGEDQYEATLSCVERDLYLRWRVQGPNKNEEIECIYSAERRLNESRTELTGN